MVSSRTPTQTSPTLIPAGDSAEGPSPNSYMGGTAAQPNEQLKQTGVINITEERDEPRPSIRSVEGMSIATPEIQSRGDQVVGNDVRAALAQLNEEQQRAHDIVEEWLKEHIASELKKNLTKITD